MTTLKQAAAAVRAARDARDHLSDQQQAAMRQAAQNLAQSTNTTEVDASWQINRALR